jgi:hypothetical protein
MKIGFILQYLLLIVISIIISIFAMNFYSSLKDKKNNIHLILYIIAIINLSFIIICFITSLFDKYFKYILFMTYISGCLTMLLFYNIIYLNREIQNYNYDYFFIIIAILPIYTILWYNIISSGSYYKKYKEFITNIMKNNSKISNDDILGFHNFKYKYADPIAIKISNILKNSKGNYKEQNEIIKKLLFLNN